MLIHPSDTVEVRSDGQKYAVRPIRTGEDVIKYGFPIGHATRDIAAGDMITTENLKSNINGLGEWTYLPAKGEPTEPIPATFMGYRREDGEVGIRNDILIIPTVGCASATARRLADATGAIALTHPYGCSQLGGDLITTQRTLCGLICHPNAGGVLVLGLGCENNGIERMKETIAKYRPDADMSRIRFLNLQDCLDEMAEGRALIAELCERASRDERTPVPLSALRIGVKCGGSDGYSGITANPLVGLVSDMAYAHGATVLMSELPEIFGAEEILLRRSDCKETFERAVAMIRAFRQYFIDHGEGISDNPSPGNIAGGITTLEEKSLGCVQKAGKVPLRGALDFGELPRGRGGLYLVNGPGNDQVSTTALAASGAHIVLFTTGRGRPLCAPVPTIKISTNTSLAKKKPHWIDLDAGVISCGADKDELASALFSLCIDVANGKTTLGEEHGCRDVAIFKDGVTL